MNETDDFGCPIVPTEDRELLLEIEFWTNGIIRPTVGILGILGNGLISVTVMNKNMRNKFNELMGS